MKNIFEKRMMWIVLVFILISIWNTVWISHGTWDLNRSIGWGWDITNFLFWISFYNFLLLLINLIGYLFLLILKRRTNYFLSILHSVLLVLSFVIFQFEIEIVVFYLFILVVVFILNLTFSTKSKP